MERSLERHTRAASVGSVARSERSCMTSEFGSGLVTCLGKFSEHLSNNAAERCHAIAWAAARTPAERERIYAEAAQLPLGDTARRLSLACTRTTYSDALEMWANGASDHFYDLRRSVAPAPLKQLADLTLRVGHGFTGESWTPETWNEIWQLWKRSCLAVDRRLGLTPEWGRW
jgi:hypothetical protein